MHLLWVGAPVARSGYAPKGFMCNDGYAVVLEFKSSASELGACGAWEVGGGGEVLGTGAARHGLCGGLAWPVGVGWGGAGADVVGAAQNPTALTPLLPPPYPPPHPPPTAPQPGPANPSTMPGQPGHQVPARRAGRGRGRATRARHPVFLRACFRPARRAPVREIHVVGVGGGDSANPPGVPRGLCARHCRFRAHALWHGRPRQGCQVVCIYLGQGEWDGGS